MKHNQKGEATLLALSVVAMFMMGMMVGVSQYLPPEKDTVSSSSETQTEK